MIDFIDISKHFGTQDVLVNASFRVNTGERAGIVGPNGAGKSTIFKLIAGDMPSDKGSIQLPSNTRLGYLRQQLNPHNIDLTLRDYTAEAIPELRELHEQIIQIEHELPESNNRDPLLQKLGTLQTRYENLGGYEMEQRAEKALSGLGFREAEFSRPFRSFSGGWQMRAELARTLIAQPDILLLDEPSNYLDLPAVEWLSGYLRAFEGTMLLISHDRYLLESLTNVTLECAGGMITRYAGNYAYYIREREARRIQLEAAHENQERRKEQIERFVERFRAKSTKASQVQSRIKQLEKMEDIRLPKAPLSLSGIRLPEPPHSGHETISLHDAGFTYDNQRWIFRNLSLQVLRGEKTALVGYNGMGKTTLLRLLAGVRPCSEGKIRLGHQVVVGYQSQEFAETMPPEQSLFRVLKETNPAASDADIRNLLGSFGFSGDNIHKTVSVLSGGEKIRLAFARIFINPPNFLLLDEPTTHLDIASREALEKALTSYKGTVCFVSHDIEFVRHVAERIIAITPNGIENYSGNYDYYREKAGAANDSSAQHPKQVVQAKKLSRKERAAQHEQKRKQLMTLRKAVRTHEQKIDQLENEQQQLVEALTREEGIDYAQTNQRLNEIQQELTRHTDKWEAASIELEELETIM